MDESLTIPGRQAAFEARMLTDPRFAQVNPWAQRMQADMFDPWSAKYSLAAAPISLGGWGQFGAGGTVAPTFESFADPNLFGGYGARPQWDTVGTAPTAGDIGWSPMDRWSQAQWGERLAPYANVDLGAEGYYGSPVETYLRTLDPKIAQQIITQAATAGLNPMMRQAAQAGLQGAFADFTRNNRMATGGDMLRAFSEQFTGGNWQPRYTSQGIFGANPNTYTYTPPIVDNTASSNIVESETERLAREQAERERRSLPDYPLMPGDRGYDAWTATGQTGPRPTHTSSGVPHPWYVAQLQAENYQGG
jgi:hypothetical protein